MARQSHNGGSSRVLLRSGFYWAPLAAVSPPPPAVRGLFSLWPTHGDLSTSWLDCNNPFTQPQNPITLALEKEREGQGVEGSWGEASDLDSVCVSSVGLFVFLHPKLYTCFLCACVYSVILCVYLSVCLVCVSCCLRMFLLCLCSMWVNYFLYMWPYENLYVWFLLQMCVCAFSLCAFWWIGPPAVDKRLRAGGGSQLVTSCYIIAAFSSSETNLIESWYYKESLCVSVGLCVCACECSVMCKACCSTVSILSSLNETNKPQHLDVSHWSRRVLVC